MNTSQWAQALLSARTANEPFPNISKTEPTLDLAAAYTLQRAYTDALVESGESICGFKGALTAEAAQKSMGVTTPIIGALLASGDLTHPACDGNAIAFDQVCLLETEIGLTLGTDVSSEVTAQDVPHIIEACMPMIEVASPNLVGKPNGSDLVATNSASFGYIQGDATAPDWSLLDDLSVSLDHAGARLHQGSSGEVLGGQCEAAAWLINTALEQGYVLSAGAILMTGSIGGIAPARPGDYLGSFGALGEIRFSIE